MDNLWNMTFWQIILIVAEFVGSAVMVGTWLALVCKVFMSFRFNITMIVRPDK